MNAEIQTAKRLLTETVIMAADHRLTLLSSVAFPCNFCDDSGIFAIKPMLTEALPNTDVLTGETDGMQQGMSLLELLSDEQSHSMPALLSGAPGQYQWQGFLRPGVLHPDAIAVQARVVVLPDLTYQGFPVYQLFLTRLAPQSFNAIPAQTKPDCIKTARDILDIVPDAVVYVVSANHKLLYLNKTALEHFPQAHVGMVCHELFMGCSSPCDGCVCLACHEQNPIFNAIWPFSPFAYTGAVSITAARIQWEQNTVAYVVFVTEHVRTNEERDLIQQKNSYIHALCDTYDYVLDIDAETDNYNLVALRDVDELFHEKSNYTKLLQDCAEFRIVPEFREPFLERFSLENLKREFKNGATSVAMHYPWQKPGMPVRWKSRLALPYRLIPGATHILAYVQDITEEKERETRYKNDESQYLQALKNVYTEIFHINIPSMTITPLYYNSSLLAMEGKGTPLVPFMEKRAIGRLHPDSTEIMAALYNPERIRDQILRGETFEAEYRKRESDDGAYRWISVLILPISGNPDGALLLMRDVTAMRQEQNNYLLALQSSYAEIFQLNLKDGSMDPLYYNSEEVPISAGTVAIDLFVDKRASTRLHPDFEQLYRDFYALDHVRDAISRSEIIQVEYQKYDVAHQQYRWTAAAIQPVPSDSQSALLMVRDITDQKIKEEERLREAQRFSLALRGVYCEVYEMDVDAEQSSLLFSNDTDLIPVGTERLRGTHEIISSAIHPDDQGRVRTCFRGEVLRHAFEAGETEVTEDFRRLAYDGSYHWISAVVVPLRDGDVFSGKVMLMVKDIGERKAMELRQRVSDQYFLALRNLYDLLFEFNATQNTYQCVHRGTQGYAYPPNEGALNDLITHTAVTLTHPAESARLLQFLNLDNIRAKVGSKKDGDAPYSQEFRTLRSDGEYQWTSITVLGVPTREYWDLEDEIYLVFFMDIHARKQAEELQHQNTILERQRLDDERYRIIVEQTNTLVFEWNTMEATRYQSPELERRFAGTYDSRELLRVWHEDAVVHPGDMPMFENFLRNKDVAPRAEMTVRLLRRAGGYIWCKVELAKLHGLDGELTRVIGTINDVDEATRSVAALQYRAEYDPLTGILNTATFYARSELLLHKHPDRTWYIVRMDIDRFKVINDLYGLQEGDLLLKKLARMLDVRVKGHGVCARISGDVFCACVDFDRATLVSIVQEISEDLKNYPLASSVMLSFGLCAVDDVSTPINVLCDWANLALKTIKGNVMVSYAFYDGTLRARILEEKRIETEMRDALARGDFTLYLQPKVHIATGRIIGAEGLVRWNHPLDGIIVPDLFIPLFERNGFIINLDEYVWDLACATLRRWIDMGLTPLPISINVSRLHIHDLRLTEKLLKLVDKYQLPPSLLELELTESLFFDSETQMFDAISSLQGHGFNFSLDDFGAGYSSLNMLKSMPIEIIKIDRGFLNEVSATERGKTIIRHTIALAKAMDMKVVAEGVETHEQAQFLLGAQCELAQGYFYSPPIPVSSFEALSYGPDGHKTNHFAPVLQ